MISSNLQDKVLIKCYKSQLLHNSEVKLDAFQVPFLWKGQSLMSNPFREMIYLLSIHVLRHKPAYCREERSNLHRTDTVSRGRGPQEPGPEIKMEGGKAKKNKKRSILFLKATAEQQVREPGRQRQAKEATSAHQQEKLRWNHQLSAGVANVDSGGSCPSSGTQEVMEQTLSHQHGHGGSSSLTEAELCDQGTLKGRHLLNHSVKALERCVLYI